MKNYKSRYEDALDRAKEAVKNGMVSENFVKDIFKESYETEDEKIRKEIIQFIQSKTNFPSRWISWLEKQSEQSTCQVNWIKNDNDNKPSQNTSVLMLTTHGVAEGEWLGDKWHQYRWSCTLNDKDVLCWLSLDDLNTNVEQRPVKLAEEDETNLRQTEYAVMKFFGGDCLLVDWLRKSLRPQSHWKPSYAQLEALSEEVRLCEWEGRERPILKELLTQLKKL